MDSQLWHARFPYPSGMASRRRGRVGVIRAVVVMAAVMALMPSAVFAAVVETIDSPADPRSPNCSVGASVIGNSFTVGVDGVITQIGVYPRRIYGAEGEFTTPIVFHQGDGFAGPVLGSQDATFVGQSDLVLTMVTLDSPIPVTADQIYTFSVSDACGSQGEPSPSYGFNRGVYAGGTFHYTGGPLSHLDMGFRIVIEDGPVDDDGDGIPDTAPPTDKDDCKKQGWESFNNPTFRNQGQCVKWVNHNT